VPEKKKMVRRIPSDDYSVEFEGEKIFPHAGELVEVCGGPSWQFMRDSANLARFETKENYTPEEGQEIVRSLDSLVAFISTRIVAWSWTGPDGKDLPQPTIEVISNLEMSEVKYLIQLMNGGTAQAKQEEQGNS
jgi:hypothetical protein